MNEAPEYENLEYFVNGTWNLVAEVREKRKKKRQPVFIRSFAHPQREECHKCPIVDRRGYESECLPAHCRRPRRSRRRSLTPLTTFYLKFGPKWGPLDKFPGFTASHPISRRQWRARSSPILFYRSLPPLLPIPPPPLLSSFDFFALLIHFVIHLTIGEWIIGNGFPTTTIHIYRLMIRIRVLFITNNPKYFKPVNFYRFPDCLVENWKFLSDFIICLNDSNPVNALQEEKRESFFCKIRIIYKHFDPFSNFFS